MWKVCISPRAMCLQNFIPVGLALKLWSVNIGETSGGQTEWQKSFRCSSKTESPITHVHIPLDRAKGTKHLNPLTVPLYRFPFGRHRPKNTDFVEMFDRIITIMSPTAAPEFGALTVQTAVINCARLVLNTFFCYECSHTPSCCSRDQY